MSRLILILALIPAIVSCRQSEQDRRAFVAQPHDKMVEELRSMPVDRQIPLYLYAMERVRPRPVGLAVEIAQGGEGTAHVVGRLISATGSNVERVNLLMILSSMKQMGRFDSCRDPSIMRNIRPRAYSADDVEGQLVYALDFVDLCS